MRSTLSAAPSHARPPAATVVRASAVALLTLLVVSCHSETTAPAIPKSLEFSLQPANTDAVSALGPIRITALDASGRVVTTFLGQVTIALGNNPSSATLGGTKSVSAIAGVATFSNLTVNRPGTGYTLAVSASGVTQTSAAFNIVPGPVANLVFSAQPVNTTAGMTITPAIQVQAMDGAGNLVTPFGGNVTMAIGTNPAGGTLSGTATVAAAAGIATFNSLSIDKAGTGYKLTATAGAGSGQSAAFDITAATATQLVFTTQPTATAAGSNVNPAVVVTAEDQFNNRATSFSSQVTIAITAATGKAGATLSGTKTQSATTGVVTFADLNIDSVGTGYTLSATATGLVGAFASANFNIVPGAATQLVFTGQPAASTTAGVAMSAVVVTARDAKGNTATGFNVAVKIAISAGAGTPGAKLSGADTVTATAASGLATFNTLRIDKSGAGYTLSASATGLTTATSSAFSITVAPAVKLAFAVQPSNTAAGAAIAPTVQVTILDSLGNTTGSTATVVVAITSNTGTPGALLTGGASVSRAAAGGVVTFSAPDTLAIDKVGNGYTLTATSGALTPATSTSFNTFANTATHLTFTVQPANAVAGPPATLAAVKVTALDGSNNPVPGFTGGVTLAITNGTGTLGAALGGTKTVNAIAGVATFSDLSIDKTGDGYTLDASASALSGTTSTAFKITPAAATHLVFTFGQPSDAVAGQFIAPPVKVAALDAHENLDTAFTNPITVALGTNPGSGNLGGTLIRLANHGISTFNDLDIDKSGVGYQLLATAGSLTSPLSTTFNITAALAKQMAFTTQPTATTAGLAIAPAVVVTVQDSLGNTATGFNNPVKLAISGGTGTPNAHLTHGDTVTVTAINGVAAFPNLRIDSAGAGYILSASTAGLTAAASTSFNILPGNATTLVFTGQPTNADAGVAIAPPVQVTARDSLGNRDTTFKTGIMLALTGGTAGAHLSHAASVVVTAVAGVSTFSTLSVDSAGNNYALSATASGGLTGGPSSTFNIASTPAVSLAITGQPVTAVAGSPIAVQVTARDSLGNTAKSFDGLAHQVTLAILNNGGNPVPGNLSGGLATPTLGVANFSVSIDKVGTGYTLHSTVPFVSLATNAFDITPGAASQLAFTVQPVLTAVGAQISPAVKVTAQDANGNTAPTFVNNVTMAIGNNAGPGTLSGQVTRAAIGGVATFSNLSLDVAGTGYTLTAASAGLSTGTSVGFNVVASVADHLFFTVQPTAGTAGQSLAAISVAARDPSNQTVTSYTSDVTVTIQSGTGTAGANLTGTTTATTVNLHMVNGVATFDDLKIDKVGTGYKLLAASGSLTSATSASFTINPGGADHLTFTLQPSRVTTASIITPQVEVTAFDNQGNVATAYTGNVSLAIHSGTGTAGAVLGGTIPKAAVGGIAVFSDLSINLPGTSYQLDAAGTGVGTGATSSAFDVTAAQAIHLAFTVQPSAATAGVIINPAIKVTALDSNNVTVTGFTNDVTLTITGGTGTAGATLSGTTTATTGNAHLVNGVATFNDITINKSGSGFRLSATASGAAGTTSVPFAISAAAAARLVFTLQPSSTTAGAALTPQVTVRDAFGNPVKNFVGTVTASLLPNSTGGSLFGTTVQSFNAATGVATFTDLVVDKSGSPYRLQATSSVGGIAPDTSNAFSITGGAPKQLLFSVQPSNAKANANLNPDVRVTALDSLGNVSTGFTDVVTLAITNGTGTVGAILSGGSVNAANGVADFPTVAIDRIGSGYTLAATTATAGVSGTTSVGFNITADRLVFTVQPSDVTHGANSITPAVKVAAEDGVGNIDASFTGDITIAKGTGSPAGTLSGTLTATVINGRLVNGVATFNDLQITLAGAGWTLKASAAAANLTPATSSTFTVN